MEVDRESLLNEFKVATEELLQALQRIDEDQFNTCLSPDQWSAGQVAEHLIKVETGTVRLFKGESAEGKRDADGKVGEIAEKLLNYEKSFNAFGAILPDEEPKNKDRALNKLQDIRQRLASYIELQDLTELLDFQHPLFGRLTRLEWIYFTIYHGRRHTHQINRIGEQLKNI